MLLNAGVAPAELDGTRVVCVPASRIAAEQGSSFGNVVMVGAVAAALGRATARQTSRRPRSSCSARSCRADSVRSAVEEGYRCVS